MIELVNWEISFENLIYFFSLLNPFIYNFHVILPFHPEIGMLSRVEVSGVVRVDYCLLEVNIYQVHVLVEFHSMSHVLVYIHVHFEALVADICVHVRELGHLV